MSGPTRNVGNSVMPLPASAAARGTSPLFEHRLGVSGTVRTFANGERVTHELLARNPAIRRPLSCAKAGAFTLLAPAPAPKLEFGLLPIHTAPSGCRTHDHAFHSRRLAAGSVDVHAFRAAAAGSAGPAGHGQDS